MLALLGTSVSPWPIQTSNFQRYRYPRPPSSGEPSILFPNPEDIVSAMNNTLSLSRTWKDRNCDTSVLHSLTGEKVVH